MADGKSRVVVGLWVTPGDRQEHDETVGVVDQSCQRLGGSPEAVCGDAAYGSGVNAFEMAQRGIRLVAPPPKAKTFMGEEFFNTESFVYDESVDVFTCPAGKQLVYIYTEKQRGRRIYRARGSDCRICPLKSQCTTSKRRALKVTANHASLIRLRADSKTDDFKKLYRSRAPVIEGVFAEAKQWHSLGRAWRRGLVKMRVQCLLIATVINLKRVMAVDRPLSGLVALLRFLLRHIGTSLEPFWRPQDQPTQPWPQLTL